MQDLLDPVKLRRKLPPGFRIEKFSVEIHGVCKAVPQRETLAVIQFQFITETTRHVRCWREIP